MSDEAASTVGPTERHGVACGGSVVVDLVKAVGQLPEPNRMAVIDEVATATGGPAMNMAVDLRMLGADYPLWVTGAVGADANGAFVRDECRRHHIDDRGLRTVDGVATAFTDVMVEPSGRRTMFHHAGSSHRLEPSMIEIDRLAAAILHLGSPGIHDRMDGPSPDGQWPSAWVEILARAQAAGMHTNMELVDLPADRQLDMAGPCLPHLDSLVINELEAGALTGIDVRAPAADGEIDWDALETMAGRLIDAGVRRLAVIHVPGGCVAAAPGERRWRHGSVRLPDDQIRSVVGAGDAFAAGVVHALHQDWSVERALELAVASAAASVRGLTTSDAIEPAEACLALANRYGHRPVGR